MRPCTGSLAGARHRCVAEGPARVKELRSFLCANSTNVVGWWQRAWALLVSRTNKSKSRSNPTAERELLSIGRAATVRLSACHPSPQCMSAGGTACGPTVISGVVRMRRGPDATPLQHFAVSRCLTLESSTENVDGGGVLHRIDLALEQRIPPHRQPLLCDGLEPRR